MITPRRIALCRAADLAGYRTALVDIVRTLEATLAADTFVLVPTSAAAGQLRRTIRERLGAVEALPLVGTRADLYHSLLERLPSPPRMLTAFERDAMLAAGARDAEDAGAPRSTITSAALVERLMILTVC